MLPGNFAIPTWRKSTSDPAWLAAPKYLPGLATPFCHPLLGSYSHSETFGPILPSPFKFVAFVKLSQVPYAKLSRICEIFALCKKKRRKFRGFKLTFTLVFWSLFVPAGLGLGSRSL